MLLERAVVEMSSRLYMSNAQSAVDYESQMCNMFKVLSVTLDEISPDVCRIFRNGEALELA